MASTGPCTIPALSCTTLTILTHRRRPSQPRRLFPPLLVSRNLRGAGLFSANALVGGHTVVVTQTSTAGAATAAPPSGPNTAGIAAGVVVAVVVVGAIVGGVFFYMRRRRNHEIEEEHRRNAAVSSFINGGHPPSSSSSPLGLAPRPRHGPAENERRQYRRQPRLLEEDPPGKSRLLHGVLGMLEKAWRLTIPTGHQRMSRQVFSPITTHDPLYFTLDQHTRRFGIALFCRWRTDPQDEIWRRYIYNHGVGTVAL